MDPGGGFGGDVFTTLKTNFDQAYNGNRAPFPVFVHAPWFNELNIAATNKFIEYALGKGDVYFVTMRELLNWMKNPVPASQYKNMASCKKVQVTPPLLQRKCEVYEIQAGDTLEAIAGKYGILTVAELMSVNPSFQALSLQPGMRMRIPPWDENCPTDIQAMDLTPPANPEVEPMPMPMPVPEPVPPTVPSPAIDDVPQVQPPPQNTNVLPNEGNVVPETIDDNNDPVCKTWTVLQGEFLEGIAAATNESAEEIATLNGIELTSTLDIGQKLKIPPYPACCDTQSCATESEPPPSRVDIIFASLNGPILDVSMQTKLSELLSADFKINVDKISISTVTERKSRRLKQTSSSQKVIIHVASANPESTYDSIDQALRYAVLYMTTKAQYLDIHLNIYAHSVVCLITTRALHHMMILYNTELNFIYSILLQIW